jgi:hypothetical protein
MYQQSRKPSGYHAYQCLANKPGEGIVQGEDYSYASRLSPGNLALAVIVAVAMILCDTLFSFFVY